MTRPTGLLPRRPETRRLYAAERAYGDTPQNLATVVQRVSGIRDQRAKPSCVGQALAACVDALDPRAHGVRCSAVDLWVDARRRQGDLEGVHDGTRAEYAIESLIHRGWSPRADGEDTRPEADDARLTSLSAELSAYDHRLTGARHYAITGNRVAQTIAALRAGLGVVVGTGTRPSYGSPPRDVVLGLEYLGGDDDGHEQRIVGWSENRRAFVAQNSWGAGWGGCVVDGVTYPGCALVSPEVIGAAWDVDAIEVSR